MIIDFVRDKYVELNNSEFKLLHCRNADNGNIVRAAAVFGKLYERFKTLRELYREGKSFLKIALGDIIGKTVTAYKDKVAGLYAALDRRYLNGRI